MVCQKDGTLVLSAHDFDHIQGHMDDDEMTLQEAVETEVELMGLEIKDIYSIEMSLGLGKRYIDMFCRIACEVKTGRSK
jgi:hypothetical protein